MQYIHVIWHHDFPDDPTGYYSEVGDDRWEVRRVQEYRDGRLEWTDATHETDTAGLGETEIDLDDIRSQAEFELTIIDKAAFEVIWNKARS